MTDAATSYAGYVVAAYSVSVLLIGGLVLWTFISGRMARREILALEVETDRVFGRRGAPTSKPAADLKL